MIKLKDLRKSYGMTQADLAKKIGVSKSTLSMYENGIHEPDLETLKRLADVFSVSLDVLLNRKKDSDDEDTWLIRDRMRNDPDYRILFDAAKSAKPEHLRAAVAVLKTLKGEENAY